MSIGLLSMSGQPLTSFGFSIPFSGEKTFSIKTQGEVGLKLRSVDGPNVFWYGRFNDADSWTALSSGLDLSSYPNVIVEIKIRVVTNEATTPKQQKTTLYLQ